MQNKWIKLAGVAMAVGMATAAQAVPTLIVDGVTKAVDQGAGDLNPLIGEVLWSGLINNWEVSEDFGIASPPDTTHGGTVTAPVLDVSFNAIYLGTGSSTLTLTFVADHLGPFSTSGLHTIGGTLTSGMTVSGAILVNGVPVPSLALGPFSTTSYHGSATGSPVGGPNSTITIQTTLTANGTAKFASGDESLVIRHVPDSGTTLALFGAALSGFALLRRKLNA